MKITSSTRTRTVAYWATTAVMLWEMWVVGHLGYPAYVLTLLGMGKPLAGVAMALPRLPRLKEWAYAGAFFTYAGAVASAIAVGDSVDQWAGSAIFGAICLASWYLRPVSRRDPQGAPALGAISPTAR